MIFNHFYPCKSSLFLYTIAPEMRNIVMIQTKVQLFCATLLLIHSLSVSAKMNIAQNLMLSDATYHDDDDEESLDMSAELGVLFASGNNDGTTITSRLSAKQNSKAWSNQYSANVLYKQNEQNIQGVDERITSAQKIFVSAQCDYKLEDPTHRLFMYSEYEDDRFNNYDYQAALAFGWTDQLWSSATSEFRYSIGPGYAVSKLKPLRPGSDQNGVIVRAAMEFEKKFGDQATFRQFLSTETDNKFSRSVSETSLAAKINGSLAMKLSLNMIHNVSPEQVNQSLDTQTSITLVYQFF